MHIICGDIETIELAAIFREELEVVVKIADEKMYQVVGKR